MFGRINQADDHDLAWLLREGKVLASVQLPKRFISKVAAEFSSRSDDDDRVLLLDRMKVTHSFGRPPLDVAFVDREMEVLKTLRLTSNRITAPCIQARAVLIANAGAFGRWNLNVGDVLELRFPDDGS